MRRDAGHRKDRATRSESSEKTQVLSPLGRVGGRQQALEMPHIACALLPTRRDTGAIPMGHYHQDLVSGAEGGGIAGGGGNGTAARPAKKPRLTNVTSAATVKLTASARRWCLVMHPTPDAEPSYLAAEAATANAV